MQEPEKNFQGMTRNQNLIYKLETKETTELNL